MDPHFVGMANVFAFYPCLKKARFTPAHYVLGSAVLTVDGIFIVQLSRRRILMLLHLKN